MARESLITLVSKPGRSLLNCIVMLPFFDTSYYALMLA